MTAKDFRATLDGLGLSQARLGRLLRVDKATPNRWAKGLVAVPASVALLLRLLDSGAVDLEALEKLEP